MGNVVEANSVVSVVVGTSRVVVDSSIDVVVVGAWVEEVVVGAWVDEVVVGMVDTTNTQPDTVMQTLPSGHVLAQDSTHL